MAGVQRQEHYSNWLQIPDHPYKRVIVERYGSAKMNVLINLINHRLDIDKIFLYAKDPYGTKYQYLMKRFKEVDLKHLKCPNAFVEYSNDMNDVY